MKLDPRTRLVMVICISTLALIYNAPGRLFLLLVCTMVLLLISRVNLGGMWGYFKPVLPLFLALFLIQSLFSPGGRVLLSVGSLPLITMDGLSAGAGVVLRMGVVIAVAILLTAVNSRDFVQGLVQCKIPYEVAFMVSVAIRFLPVFREEISNVVTAVQLRGVELKRVPWGQKLALYRLLFFPVVYGAVLKARQLAVAMEARAFKAYPRRTYLRKLNLGFTDYAVMLLFSAITIILIGLQISWLGVAADFLRRVLSL